MPRCVRCRATPVCSKHRNYRLVKRDHLHPTMWLNPFVVSGYRPTKMSKEMCLSSIFHITNETVNIWSHLLGFFYFSYCQFDTNWYRLPMIGAESTDHLVMTASLAGAQMCMLFSAAYHIFGCTSEESRQKWLKCDIFGITAGLLAMYLSGIYTAFFCFKDELETYLYTLVMIFLITIYVPFRSDFFERKIIGSRIGFMHIIYTIVIIFGICPTSHWVVMHGGFSDPYVSEWLPNVVVLYSLIGSAFFFYVSLIPERLSPGTFDVVGCSHQWWHLLILSAMVWWQRAGLELLTHHRLTSSCSALLQPETSLNSTATSF